MDGGMFGRIWETSLVNFPILRSPDFDGSFIVQTDVSDFAVGAVLSQEYDGEEHPVAYLSRKLSPRELNVQPWRRSARQ